jgi:hypothetical protein
MTWNIQDGKEQDYIEFAVGELGPKLSGLGLQIKDVWYTVAGAGPEMVLIGEMNTRSDAEGLFASREWGNLEKRLNAFVEDVKVKFVKPKGGFQM